MKHMMLKHAMAGAVLATLCAFDVGADQQPPEALQGWQIWEKSCAALCHPGIQMPPLPDDPDQVRTALRHMRTIGNFPAEWIRELEHFLLAGEEDLNEREKEE